MKMPMSHSMNRKAVLSRHLIHAAATLVFLSLPQLASGQDEFPVTVTTAGGGEVVASPDGPLYPADSVVTISATASNGWTFMHWQGDAVGTENPLNLTIDGPKNVAAVFGTTVETSVTGSGVIELSATNPIAYGTVVQATAVPDEGSYFVQWSGTLAGSNNPAQFTVASTNHVGAVFGTLPPGQVALTVKISGSGNVEVAPQRQFYTVGETVLLRATASSPFNQFDGWSGDLVTTTNSVLLTLNTSKVVTANFSLFAPQLYISRIGSLVQLRWTVFPLAFPLEASTEVSARFWRAPTNVVESSIVGNEMFTTLTPSMTRQFFRLRGSPPIPISQFAVFFNSLMEYTWCAEFIINGRVHANGSIYTGSKQRLIFNGPVTATGVIASPSWAGHTNGEYLYTGTYNGTPDKATNIPAVSLSINMVDPRCLIEIPPQTEAPDSILGKQRLYNQANVVLLISNSIVHARLQEGVVPGADPGFLVVTSAVTPDALAARFPFLTLLWATNGFIDQREGKVILASQIDISLFKAWLTNPLVAGKFNSANGEYPTILYVADNRTTTASQLTAIRIRNGLAPPSNGGRGFTVATPNPLYVWGHYNCPNTAYLGSSNTVAAGTVPCALLSDALTLLSHNWVDAQSGLDLSDGAKNRAAHMTVNAAILTGLVYSTGPNSGQFSGGVMNLARLLEHWGDGMNQVLTLNTALMNLYPSARATAQFRDPGDYYYAPKRKFNFDNKFLNPGQHPPGIPLVMAP